VRRLDLDPEPLRQFERWFEEARAGDVRVPEAAALATASAEGFPSARMVLVKGADERGFVFYTGYDSRKARELAENPKAALLFHWPYPAGRQVRIEGLVERVAEEESDAYFATRPAAARLSAWASPQSQPVPDRETLERQVEAERARFGRDEIPRPPKWGGFRLVPSSFEFWEHRDDRLHDRFRFGRGSQGGWLIERLAP
jgi:pyridoxamine 5'-phosphate oxidase